MKLIVSILSLVCVFSVSAQEVKEKIAEKKYEGYSYIDAIAIYEKVAEKGHVSVELFQKLGDSYYFNGMLDKSKVWYDKLFQIENQSLNPEYYFRYSQSLKAVKSYKEADKIMEKFYALTNDYRGELYVKNKLYLVDLNNSLDKYTITDAGINSEFSDYGGNFKDTKMYFVSNRIPEKNNKKIDKWTNQNFSNIYRAEFSDSAKAVYIDEIVDEFNTKYHESSLVFSKDGKTMYFTRNNFNNGKVAMDKDKVIKLKLFSATLENGKWNKIVALPFNNNEYNVAHPALSPDGKTLYFASDMPGGFGNSDLYKVTINEDGTYGNPENLGDKINTKARETFPFVASDGTLYFSSDGLIGMGGLDVFKSIPDENGNYSSFHNVGAPINSERDDFGFIESPFKNIYFISSNREGGKGYDDIYKIKLNDEPKKGTIINTVVDEISKEPIANSKITLLDANQNKIAETLTDSKGNFIFNDVRADREYYILVADDSYLTKQYRVKGTEDNNKMFEIAPKIIQTKPGDDLVKLLNITIYFDLDKYFIRPDAEVELAKIIEILKMYPNLKIDIRSHTDSRQSEAYNLRLSTFRANATRDYLINKGIAKERLTCKGYGESQLINNCTNEVPCTREQHQQNRRSEFIISDM
ncbi:OmpA family protein [Flavobacterium sp. HXWNR69]|uniref:OmpA family protein n=1 Tax=Flavobacterium fragile TaxID=2949085 RepID=A0ABT0TJN7_9FLAO|nr:OmpA family protein [Flavobacterium sp. HXWNR69]MCL9771194.1 OmpA family protein [Flavobacterium sp. HXWNR69]